MSSSEPVATTVTTTEKRVKVPSFGWIIGLMAVIAFTQVGSIAYSGWKDQALIFSVVGLVLVTITVVVALAKDNAIVKLGKNRDQWRQRAKRVEAEIARRDELIRVRIEESGRDYLMMPGKALHDLLQVIGFELDAKDRELASTNAALATSQAARKGLADKAVHLVCAIIGNLHTEEAGLRENRGNPSFRSGRQSAADQTRELRVEIWISLLQGDPKLLMDATEINWNDLDEVQIAFGRWGLELGYLNGVKGLPTVEDLARGSDDSPMIQAFARLVHGLFEAPTDETPAEE